MRLAMVATDDNIHLGFSIFQVFLPSFATFALFAPLR